MKQNFLQSHEEKHGKCKPAACLACRECKVINFEERRGEWKSASAQLYAKEAESYFFYYALNMKQGG